MENRTGHREKKADKTGLEEMEMGKIFYLMGKSASGKDSIYTVSYTHLTLPTNSLV